MNAHTCPRKSRFCAMTAAAWFALCAAAPLVAVAAPPTAPAPGFLEAKVSLADLDLSTAEGVRAAHKRLRAKAESMCRELWDSASATYRWMYSACVNATFASAIQQLNAPALAAVERARAEP